MKYLLLLLLLTSCAETFSYKDLLDMYARGEKNGCIFFAYENIASERGKLNFEFLEKTNYCEKLYWETTVRNFYIDGFK